MKLHQHEYCHGCQQVVRFEFEDVTGRQVIPCPNCGHQHFREIDAGNLTNIRMDRARDGDYVAIFKPIRASVFSANELAEPVHVDTARVVGIQDGRAVIDREVPGTTPTKAVTTRRWGRDLRQ